MFQQAFHALEPTENHFKSNSQGKQGRQKLERLTNDEYR